MKISESRFRQILREEAKKIIHEQTFGYPQIVDPGWRATTSVARKISTIAKGVPPGTIRALAIAAAIWFSKKKSKEGTASAIDYVVGGGEALTIGGAATNAVAGGVANYMGGGALAAGEAVATALAPAALVFLGAYLVGWTVEEGINAFVAGVDARDANTPTAIKTGIRGVYVIAANRGKVQKLWTSQDLKIPGEALNDFLNNITLDDQHLAALSLVFSVATDADVDSSFKDVEDNISKRFIDRSAFEDAREKFKKTIANMQGKISEISSKVQS